MQNHLIEISGTSSVNIFQMIIGASIIVKVVIGILGFMSILVWAIILEKLVQLGNTNARIKKFEKEFWSGRPLEELYKKIAKLGTSPFNDVFVSGMREWIKVNKVKIKIKPQEIATRTSQMMYAQADLSLSKLENNLPTLAIIASSSPFIGLFGTVMGVMNAFSSIGQSNDTSLATVAPGIAEALFVTGLGLFVAIPALIFYNSFSAKVSLISVKLNFFVNDFSALIWRRLETTITE